MAQYMWRVKDVDEATRRHVKAYAAANGLSMAQAVKQLVDTALSSEKSLGGPKPPVGATDRVTK